MLVQARNTLVDWSAHTNQTTKVFFQLYMATDFNYIFGLEENSMSKMATEPKYGTNLQTKPKAENPFCKHIVSCFGLKTCLHAHHIKSENPALNLIDKKLQSITFVQMLNVLILAKYNEILRSQFKVWRLHRSLTREMARDLIISCPDIKNHKSNTANSTGNLGHT